MMTAINSSLKTIIDFAAKPLQGALENLSMPEELMGLIGGTSGDELFNGSAMQRHIAMLTGSNIGKNITSAGFDVSLIVGIATGNISALENFAKQHRVPIEIVQIMIALAIQNADGVIQGIGDWAGPGQEPGLGLEGPRQGSQDNIDRT